MAKDSIVGGLLVEKALAGPLVDVGTKVGAAVGAKAAGALFLRGTRFREDNARNRKRPVRIAARVAKKMAEREAREKQPAKPKS
jgi:hypothetical protein